MIANILNQIDQINATDPNQVIVDGQTYPKEVLYAHRMTEMLSAYKSDPSPALQIAARGQHIQRWAIPRSDYPMDRKGYLKWRTTLKLFHADLLAGIMEKEGADQALIDSVKDLVTKKRLKQDAETQQLEDVICLVFLKYYFSEFAADHDEEKVVAILQKTWAKMTEKGHQMALALDFSDEDRALIARALV